MHRNVSSWFDGAAKNGDMAIMDWLHEKRCKFDRSAFVAAAEAGHVHALGLDVHVLRGRAERA